MNVQEFERICSECKGKTVQFALGAEEILIHILI